MENYRKAQNIRKATEEQNFEKQVFGDKDDNFLIAFDPHSSKA